MANDWRQVIRDQVAVRAAEANQRTTGTSQNIRISRVGFSPDAHPYLVRAARKRGISLAGYIRRATMAMVALDLDMDARDLFELDMAIRPITNRERPSKDLDGELYGSWEVRRGPGAS